MGFRQVFGGSTPLEYFTDVFTSIIWGVYGPQIFDGWGFVKYLGNLHPPKYFTDVVPSNIWGLYTPKIFDGWGSVKYLEALQPQNIARMWFRQIFGGSTPREYFTDVVPSNI